MSTLPDRYKPLKTGLKWPITFVLVIGTTDLLYGRYAMGTVDMLTVLGMVFAYWLACKRYALQKLQHLIVFLAAFIFMTALLDGGLVGAGFIWSMGFPVMACFLAGARPGLYWAIAYAPAVAFALYLTGANNYLMHYSWPALLYALSAYVMFTGFSFLMALASEHREQRLLKAEQQARDEAAALAESEQRIRMLMDFLPDAVGVNVDHRWAYANPAAARLFGAASAQDLLGTVMLDYVHPDDRAMAIQRKQKMIESGMAAPLREEKMLRINGEAFDAEVKSRPIRFDGHDGILVILHDITARKCLEQERENMQMQMAHKQRLEELGILAGGIAHDFNNLLAAIMGNAEFAAIAAGAGSKAASYLANVDQACNQASVLCKQMLAYAGKGEFTIRAIQLDETLRNMGNLLRASLGKKVRIHIRLEPGLPTVLADYAQLQQIILNLIVNGSDAIGDAQGDITLAARSVLMDAQSLQRFSDSNQAIVAGLYVSISVRDTGCGMDARTLKNMFVPFFTTKKTGNGLGLSAILGMVQRQHGAIKVESEPGAGTVVELLMPCAEQTEVVKAVAQPEPAQLQGGGLVLLVDDERSIRLLLGNMLESMGFDVIRAEDGMAGVELFQRHSVEVVAVVMDMTMPRLNGVEAMCRMRAIRPEVPVLLVSGYNEVEIEALELNSRPDAFIHKPFRMADLNRALSEVLPKEKEVSVGD
ncbi:MAG: response regulator [Mariprofundus sp.]